MLTVLLQILATVVSIIKYFTTTPVMDLVHLMLLSIITMLVINVQLNNFNLIILVWIDALTVMAIWLIIILAFHVVAIVQYATQLITHNYCVDYANLITSY